MQAQCRMDGVVKQQVPLRSIMSAYGQLATTLPEKRVITFSRQPALPPIPRLKKQGWAAASAQMSHHHHHHPIKP
jgi:hypothetical protein